MSIEYTIDIQLTELGFPDILQPQETSVREPPRCSTADGSLSSSQTPASLATAGKQRLLARGRRPVDAKAAGSAKQTSDIQPTASESPVPEELASEPVKSAQSPRGEQAARGSSASGLSQPPAGDAAELHSADRPQRMTEEQEDGQKGGEGEDEDDDDEDDDEEEDGETAPEGSAKVQQEVDDDSDDSDVSEVYDEEEVDEEEEEEEGLDNDSGHSGDYRCSVCDLQLTSKFKLQDHMNLHTGARPYCCVECGKRFCQVYNYRVHLRTHAQAKANRVRCRICRRGFASQEDLTYHLSSTHFEKEFYECDRCKRVFTSLTVCEYHVQLQKCMLDVLCDICGRSFSSPKSLARHKKKICYRSFKCTDCPKVFTKKNALLRHSFSHLGLLPYTCVRCRCHFRLAKLYRQHKCEPQRIHCVACLREFLNQEDFQRHKKDTGCWGNQEPKGDEIRCLECGQRFDTTEELKKHAGAHQRVLNCAECGKGFRSALLLMSHMGGHAGQSPCLCQSCGLGFPHQQNYNSHLKTCGQTPHPGSAPKKRQSSKNVPSETQKLNAKANSTSPATPVTTPAVASNSPAPPAPDSVSPEPVTESATTDSCQSDGLWKLTLDKQPPPGVNLVLFLPVCPTQTNELRVPPAVPQTLPVSAVQAHPQVALSPAAGNGQCGVNAAFGVPVSAPLDLVTEIKRDPECEAPLDLSKNCNSSKTAVGDVPLPPVKSEPEEFEISGDGSGPEKKAVFKTNPREEYTEVKRLKLDPVDLASYSTASPGPMMDPKKEPHSSGSDLDLWSSREDQRPEEEVKIEVDVSPAACADPEK